MKRVLLALPLVALAITVAAGESENEALLQTVRLGDVSHKPLREVLQTIAQQTRL